MELEIILLILIIVLVILLAILVKPRSTVLGGVGACVLANQTRLDNEPIAPGNVIIVDGMNFIHHLEAHKAGNAYVSPMRYFSLLDEASLMLTNAFPHNEIHLVFKNLDVHTFAPDDPFSNNILEMSRRHPIYYHLAFDSRDYRKAPHHISGRDDLLVTMLYNEYEQKGVYAVSLDDYIDSGLFNQIPWFYEVIYFGGEMTSSIINPAQLNGNALRSISGSHNLLKFEVVNAADQQRIKNGTLYMHKNGEMRCLNVFDVIPAC